MKASIALAVIQALAVQGIRIVQSNDDGWAELYARSFHEALTAAGHDVVLSGPAENKSGTSSRDEEPEPREDPCIYDSCPANSGPVGFNETRPELNWVNSFPVTAMKYGLEERGPQLWNGEAAELAVTGPNVGSNLFLAVHFSGTVGAAVAAVEAGVPAIAFSGASSGTLPFDTNPVPLRSTVYADLATKFTDALIASGKPYLPEGVYLNVNFPKAEKECIKVEDFKFVMTRVNPGLFSEKDVEWCGSDRLPEETGVVGRDDCFVSVSVGDAEDKTTADRERQAVVLEKLKDFLVCLP